MKRALMPLRLLSWSGDAAEIEIDAAQFVKCGPKKVITRLLRYDAGGYEWVGTANGWPVGLDLRDHILTLGWDQFAVDPEAVAPLRSIHG